MTPFPHFGGRWAAKPLGWGPADRAPDGRQYMVRLSENVGVWKPEHPEPLRREPGVAFRLVECPKRMDAAVRLHDQPGRQAGEVDDIEADGNLTAETKAVDGPVPDK